MHGQYFANTTLVVGFLPIAVGLNAILRPESALALFGFPAPPQPEGRKLARSLMQIYGARNFAMGLTTVVVWSQGDRRTLGLLLLANLPVASIDGLVSRWQTGGGEWPHWVFVPLAVGLAAGLLEWV